jgi:hypothetical protein
MYIILLVLTLFACNAESFDPPEPELGEHSSALLGTVMGNANPLTYGVWQANAATLLPGLECALTRIRAASCLPVDYSMDAWHWIRWAPKAQMNGHVGWTLGNWESNRTRIIDDALYYDPSGAYLCDILTHEIIVHSLARTNSHIGPSWPMRINEAYLTRACETQAGLGIECACFNFEE